jgi:hypothetical protein
VEQLTPGRLDIDEDPKQELAAWLTDVGHESVSTTQLGHKGKSDPWQLAFAAREGRTFVTCNSKDFVMLHEAWTSWSSEWGIVDHVAHAGILLIPQHPSIPPPMIVSAIDELIRREESLSNRLFDWRPAAGWREL